ncbi:MAG: hypothetical protein V1898_04575 [Patescibacteria group bacterium]
MALEKMIMYKGQAVLKAREVQTLSKLRFRLRPVLESQDQRILDDFLNSTDVLSLEWAHHKANEPTSNQERTVVSKIFKELQRVGIIVFKEFEIKETKKEKSPIKREARFLASRDLLPKGAKLLEEVLDQSGWTMEDYKANLTRLLKQGEAQDFDCFIIHDGDIIERYLPEQGVKIIRVLARELQEEEQETGHEFSRPERGSFAGLRLHRKITGKGAKRSGIQENRGGEVVSLAYIKSRLREIEQARLTAEKAGAEDALLDIAEDDETGDIAQEIGHIFHGRGSRPR